MEVNVKRSELIDYIQFYDIYEKDFELTCISDGLACYYFKNHFYNFEIAFSIDMGNLLQYETPEYIISENPTYISFQVWNIIETDVCNNKNIVITVRSEFNEAIKTLLDSEGSLQN